MHYLVSVSRSLTRFFGSRVVVVKIEASFDFVGALCCAVDSLLILDPLNPRHLASRMIMMLPTNRSVL